jgi:hypothetical protein
LKGEKKMENKVLKITRSKADSRVWKNRFDDYKRARAFAKVNGAKVERTNDSVMKYVVYTVGEGKKA